MARNEIVEGHFSTVSWVDVEREEGLGTSRNPDVGVRMAQPPTLDLSEVGGRATVWDDPREIFRADPRRIDATASPRDLVRVLRVSGVESVPRCSAGMANR